MGKPARPGVHADILLDSNGTDRSKNRPIDRVERRRTIQRHHAPLIQLAGYGPAALFDDARGSGARSTSELRQACIVDEHVSAIHNGYGEPDNRISESIDAAGNPAG